MQGFDAKIVFDALNKSQPSDGERFRPVIIARSTAVSQLLFDPFGGVLFENLSDLQSRTTCLILRGLTLNIKP